ncbi:MAG: hypothetical protein QXX08_05115 [Candidatus Bathyarchaeia archaeon]
MLDRKFVLTSFALFLISTCFTLYTFKAHIVAANIYEDPEGNAVSWRTGPSGTLFPWPTEPGMLQVLSEISGIDSFIYRYLIKTWILAVLSILMWVGTALFIFRIVRTQMKLKNTFRHMVETIIAVFFLLLQTMPAVGPWISLMFVPLGYYLLLYFMWHPEYLGHNISILFSQQTLLGQIVTVAGLAIFLEACIQFLGKHGKIITTGLYAVVRHPQYFGILIVTFGLSISCVQLQHSSAGGISLDTFRLNTFFIWFVEVLGYILLAYYEEYSLSKEYGEEYQEYKQKVPLLFPVPSPARIPQPFFSLITALIIALLFFMLI